MESIAQKLQFDHIGLVVKNIDQYLKNSFYPPPIAREFDPHQNCNLAMIEFSTIKMELIEPIDENATVYNFLMKKGEGLHHLCYRVNSLENLEDLYQEFNMTRVMDPVAAKLFDDKKVSFACTPNMELFEFLIVN